MTIARLLLAMIPVAIVSVIATSNSLFVVGFLEAWKFAAQLFGREFVKTDFGREWPPLIYEVGVFVGIFSIVFLCFMSVVAFAIAWSECGPKKR